MKPFVTDKDPRRGRIFSLNPNVFFFGAGLAFVAMLGMMALIRE